jgi:hypothetical protein
MEREDVRDLSIRELTAQLGEQLPQLMRDQVALARGELFARARQAVRGGGLLATAAIVGLGAWLAMVAAMIAGVAEALPVWASALIVGGALAAVAGVLAQLGRSRLARSMPPLEVTADSVRRELGELTGRNGQQ